MRTINYAVAALEDLQRIVSFLTEYTTQDAVRRVDTLIASIEVLLVSPEIGRPVSDGRRELVLGYGRTGFIALYSYDDAADEVLVLRVRAQRERGYPD